MMSEQTPVKDHIAFLNEQVSSGEGGELAVTQLAVVAARFEFLRQEYRTRPASFGEEVRALSDLSRRFEALLSRRMTELVDRYEWLREELDRLEEEKRAWREFLIRAAGGAKEKLFKGLHAEIRVRGVPGVVMPKAGTDDRNRLEAIIREVGIWESVSQLSSSKLQQEIDKGALPADRQDEVRRLCPTTTRFQVISRSSNAAAG